jgi:N-methylhydantoinase A
MRHRGQIHEVEVMLPEERLKRALLEALGERFYRRYEQLYGRDSSYRDARLEIVTLRLRASAQTPRPKLSKASRLTTVIAKEAKRPARKVYWADLKRAATTPIYDGAYMRPGNRLRGPAVVETTDTTVVLHPGRALRVDPWGNFELTFGRD